MKSTACKFLTVSLLFLLGGSGIVLANPRTGPALKDDSVFEGKPARFAPDIFGDAHKTPKDNVVRVLTVDERMGYARSKELVRVPVFFHESEAATEPGAFAIVPAGGGDPLPFQADDIRRDPKTGRISRMHLYFYADSLPAWVSVIPYMLQAQHFLLTSRRAGAVRVCRLNP